jgi:hypothetical protein
MSVSFLFNEIVAERRKRPAGFAQAKKSGAWRRQRRQGAQIVENCVGRLGWPVGGRAGYDRAERLRGHGHAAGTGHHHIARMVGVLILAFGAIVVIGHIAMSAMSSMMHGGDNGVLRRRMMHAAHRHCRRSEQRGEGGDKRQGECEHAHLVYIKTRSGNCQTAGFKTG